MNEDEEDRKKKKKNVFDQFSITFPEMKMGDERRNPNTAVERFANLAKNCY